MVENSNEHSIISCGYLIHAKSLYICPMILQTTQQRTFFLAATTLILFFVVQFFFYDEHYFHTSMLINSFVLPILYASVAFWGIWVERNKRHVGFRDAFKLSFLPMFWAGMISVAVMYMYFQFIHPEAERTFQVQRLEMNIQNAKDAEHFEIIKKTLSDEKLKSEPIFTLRNTLLFGALLTLFYVFLSWILATFLRTSTIKSN